MYYVIVWVYRNVAYLLRFRPLLRIRINKMYLVYQTFQSVFSEYTINAMDVEELQRSHRKYKSKSAGDESC